MGECPPVIAASGVTGADYVIYVFVRQVLNLLANPAGKALSIKAFTNSSGNDGPKFSKNCLTSVVPDDFCYALGKGAYGARGISA